MSHVVLCTDSESACEPAMLGLSGENLAAQTWLRLFTSAEATRNFLRFDTDTDEVWVASSDDMEPINLAAAIKRDRRERGVYLLAFQGTGSLLSRAGAAGIDATLSHQAFVRRYTDEKKRRTDGVPAVVASPSKKKVLPTGQVIGTSEELADSSSATLSDDSSSEPTDIFSAASPHISSAASAESALISGVSSSPMSTTDEDKPIVSVEHRLAVAQPTPQKSAPSGRQAFLIPVVSGSGGAGKSTVAVLAAVLAHKLGYETLLLDCDLQFGDMREMLGAPEALTIDELLAAPTRIAHLVAEKGKPMLLAAPRRLETSEAVVAEMPSLLDALAPRYDVIVANTGAFWGEPHALLLERGSKSLFLVDQRAASLRACKHAFELCTRCGIAASPFVFVANRCAKGTPYTSIDVSCALQGAPAVELRDGGRDVEDLLSVGMPLDLVTDHNDLCASIEQLLLNLLPINPTTKELNRAESVEVPRGFFQKRKARRRRGAA